MDKTLHRLETIPARGSDGQRYTVHAYEHLARIDAFTSAEPIWEPTGQAEYRLSTGAPLQLRRDGSWQSAEGGLTLQRQD